MPLSRFFGALTQSYKTCRRTLSRHLRATCRWHSTFILLSRPSKSHHTMLPLVIVLLCLPALLLVPATADQNDRVQLSQLHRIDLRDAVVAHRASQRETVRRGEANAGRRLTAAELAELREQVRQQWAARSEVARSSESQSVERMVSAPEARATQAPAPRLQRP